MSSRNETLQSSPQLPPQQQEQLQLQLQLQQEQQPILLSFVTLPMVCRVRVLNFLEQNDLETATCVSKQFHEDCREKGIENKIIPVYELTPAVPVAAAYHYNHRHSHYSKTSSLLQKLRHNRFDKYEKFRRYSHMKINRLDEFQFDEFETNPIFGEKHKNKNNDENIRIDWAKSLDLSLLTPSSITIASASIAGAAPKTTFCADGKILIGLAIIFPNLREIDLSNLIFRPDETTDMLSLICGDLRHLEKVTWNHSKNIELLGWEYLQSQSHFDDNTNSNNNNNGNINTTTDDVGNNNNNNNRTQSKNNNNHDDDDDDNRDNKNSNSNNNNNNNNSDKNTNPLKEIILDNSDFNIINKHRLTAVSDLSESYSFFIFQYCCRSCGIDDDDDDDDDSDTTTSSQLQGLSIRNAKCHGMTWRGKQFHEPCLPQNALIKFVRKAPPSLRWFRSDLTKENMEMLRLERPNIKLSN